MNYPSLALALTIALAGSAIGTASAQQYGYPNQNGYPQQQQHRHHRHRDRDGDNDDRNYGNNQQCARNYGGNYGNYGAYGNNGACQSIRGTITSVNGNQVTLQVNQGYNNNGGYGRYGGYGNGGQQITINDQPALDNQTSGRVAVGRFVTAIGYWSNGVFYATTMN